MMMILVGGWLHKLSVSPFLAALARAVWYIGIWFLIACAPNQNKKAQ
jgi:hypothetical protein